MNDPATLQALVDELHDELRAELPERLHVRHQQAIKGPRGGKDPTFGHRVGLPFSGRFERRLQHRDWYGIEYLAAASIGEVADWCRARHHSELHRSPGRTTSLCERLVSALCEWSQPLSLVAYREGISVEDAAELATAALRHGAMWRHREVHRAMGPGSRREAPASCPQCVGRVIAMRRPRRPRQARTA